MKTMTFNLNTSDPIQQLKYQNNIKYLTETNNRGVYIHGSIGVRNIILFLLKQNDISKIETEIPLYSDNKRLKTDIVIYFNNNSKGIIEFNGSQHFTWSNWYSDKFAYTKQNEYLILKEIECLNKGYSCLNFNDLTYTDISLYDDKNTPYNKLKKDLFKRYLLFFNNVRDGNCKLLRDILDIMKKQVTIISYNLKINNKSWLNGFRNSENDELNQIMFNLCKDDSFTTFI